MDRFNPEPIMEHRYIGVTTPSTYVLGYRVFGFRSIESLLEAVCNYHGALIAMNAEKVMRDDPELRSFVNRNVGYVDGIGVSLALRRKGIHAKKIAGVDLWQHVLRYFQDSHRVFLLGATPDVLNKTISKLRKDFPRLQLCGYHDGYFPHTMEDDILEKVITARPDIVLVALGSPKQERMISKLMVNHSALYMGLGGSFDVYCGVKSRAPTPLVRLGLEWLYRLAMEPTRINRQFVLIPFLGKVIFNRI